MGKPRFTRQKEPPVEPEQTEEEIPILLNPPEKNYFAIWVSGTLRRRIKAIMDAGYQGNGPEAFDCPLIQRPIKEAILVTLDQMKEAVAWYERELSDYIRPIKKFSEMKWIKDNRKLMANLIERRNRYLLPILDYLKARAIPVESKRNYPILVFPTNKDISLIKEIATHFNLSESVVTKYIAGAVENGFLKWHGPKHRGNPLLLGYKVWFTDKKTKEQIPNFSYFLKNTKEIRKALRTFNQPENRRGKGRISVNFPNELRRKKRLM